MQKKTAEKSSGTQTLLAIGAGVAALATATYYLWGPEGEKHREKMKGWMIKIKGEIVDRIEDVKELTEPVYKEIVDSVIASYAVTTKVGKDELAAFAERLKGQWKEIAASTITAKKSSKKAPQGRSGKSRKVRSRAS